MYLAKILRLLIHATYSHSPPPAYFTPSPIVLLDLIFLQATAESTGAWGFGFVYIISFLFTFEGALFFLLYNTLFIYKDIFSLRNNNKKCI
jgi:hypothetical protein